MKTTKGKSLLRDVQNGAPLGESARVKALLQNATQAVARAVAPDGGKPPVDKNQPDRATSLASEQTDDLGTIARELLHPVIGGQTQFILHLSEAEFHEGFLQTGGGKGLVVSHNGKEPAISDEEIKHAFGITAGEPAQAQQAAPVAPPQRVEPRFDESLTRYKFSSIFLMEEDAQVKVPKFQKVSVADQNHSFGKIIGPYSSSTNSVAVILNVPNTLVKRVEAEAAKAKQNPKSFEEFKKTLSYMLNHKYYVMAVDVAKVHKNKALAQLTPQADLDSIRAALNPRILRNYPVKQTKASAIAQWDAEFSKKSSEQSGSAPKEKAPSEPEEVDAVADAEAKFAAAASPVKAPAATQTDAKAMSAFQTAKKLKIDAQKFYSDKPELTAKKRALMTAINNFVADTGLTEDKKV